MIVEDYSTILTQAVHSISAGIAPHKGGRETEEYRRNVPVWLRSKAGIPADEMADNLGRQYPELGIDSENELYAQLERAQLQRRDAVAIPWEESERVNMTQPTKSTGEELMEDALREFARVLNGLDTKTIAALRNVWKIAYLATGHKHLGRLIVSGDVEAVIGKMQKKGATND